MKKFRVLLITGVVLLIFYCIALYIMDINGYNFVGNYVFIIPTIIVIVFIIPSIILFFKNKKNITENEVEKQKISKQKVSKSSGSNTESVNKYGENYVYYLQTISWMQLLISFFGGIILINQAREDNLLIQSNSIEAYINNIKSSMGIYLILSSVVLFVVLMLISHVAENVIAMRINSDKLIEKLIEKEDK